MDAISGNAEIREYLETYQLPEGMDQEDCLMEVAAKFGYECTKEELKEAYAGKVEELKAAMAAAEDAVREISPDELAQVAGGSCAAEDLFAPAEKQVEGCDNYQFVMTECPALIYPPICDYLLNSDDYDPNKDE